MYYNKMESCLETFTWFISCGITIDIMINIYLQQICSNNVVIDDNNNYMVSGNEFKINYGNVDN